MESCLDVFGTTALVFYSLWASSGEILATSGSYMLCSVPLVILLYLRYRYLLEHDSCDDPVEIIFGDKPILFMAVLYIVFIVL